MSRWILMTAVLVCGLSEVAAAQSNAVCGRRGNFNNLESVGLTADGRLLCFLERQPGQARAIAAIGGLMGGEKIIGIDFRPADGKLYGLGNAGGVYVIDAQTAAAMRISTLTGSNGAPVPLMGTSIGIDFNPVPDRLRTVSEAGQNLRINVDTGATLVDRSLTNPDGGPEGGVTAVAYTNNDASPGTNTVLYDLDIVEDQLYIQAPPNAGSLNQIGLFGVDVTATAGFDIFSQVQNDRTMRVRALSVLVIGGQTRVSQIDLTTAQVVPGPAFAANNAVIDIAIPLVQGRANR